MWRSFKLRLLGVIVLAAMVGLVVQTSNNGSKLVEPVLKIIMENRFDVGSIISRYIPILNPNDMGRLLPASGGVVLRQPCSFTAVEHSYGWYWNQDKHQEIFNPGIYLQVDDDSEVKPIMAGQVVEIDRNSGQSTVLINHSDGISSLYGCLKDIKVKEGRIISEDEVIGHTTTSFYFEVRGKDGPVNPQSIFQ